MPAAPAAPSSPRRVSFQALLPPGEPLDLGAVLDRLGLAERASALAPRRADRPYTILNMISTADGRATLGGVSGAIGDEADKQLFHGLRTVVDAVMAGAGTMRAEGYRRLIRDEQQRAARRARGLADEPLACVVSGRLALGADVPLLTDPAARVAILTASRASLPAACAAQIEYVRCADGDGRLDLGAALGQLTARFGVRTLLCEGGPHLNAQLLAAGLVDELFLSLAPKLAGDAAPIGDRYPIRGTRRDPQSAGESLRIVAGVELEPPVAMELISAHEHESQLFLRYAIR